MNSPAPPLPASLRFIAREIVRRGVRTAAALKRLIEEADVTPADLAPWADFDHSLADSYGRRLVLAEDGFEIMVMSWAPGDFSAIHDHGYARWGAVQLFGPAEHATFLAQDGALRTLDRRRMRPGVVLAVGHQLVHQMGNPTDGRFLSLHIYGCEGQGGAITADARLFALDEGCVQRTSGGVFFGLPEAEVKRREPGFEPDWPTWLRHQVELVRRAQRALAGGEPLERPIAPMIEALRHPSGRDRLLAELTEAVDADGRPLDAGWWRLLMAELAEGAALLRTLDEPDAGWRAEYARHYDEAVCGPALDGYLARALDAAFARLGVDPARTGLLSAGCATGRVERHLIERHGLDPARALGLERDPAMLALARQRLPARAGEPDALEGLEGRFGLAISTQGALQHVAPERFEAAVGALARALSPGGAFVGDLITPDFIRRFSHLHVSEGGRALTLRSPALVARGHHSLLRVRRLGVFVSGGRLHLVDDGESERHLPSLLRVRAVFERAFGGEVHLLDAITLDPLDRHADTCPSGRYLVLARRGGAPC